jgi:hypothetical protein
VLEQSRSSSTFAQISGTEATACTENLYPLKNSSFFLIIVHFILVNFSLLWLILVSILFYFLVFLSLVLFFRDKCFCIQV